MVRRLVNGTQRTLSVSVTTRPLRPGEEPGRDYHPVNPEQFDRMVRQSELLEWAQFGPFWYGTPRAPVEAARSEGKDVLLEIEMSGAAQIHGRFPSALMIFVTPPQLSDLEERLLRRGDTPEQERKWRLERAERDMQLAPKLFDVFVINRDLDRTVELIERVITAKVF